MTIMDCANSSSRLVLLRTSVFVAVRQHPGSKLSCGNHPVRSRESQVWWQHRGSNPDGTIFPSGNRQRFSRGGCAATFAATDSLARLRARGCAFPRSPRWHAFAFRLALDPRPPSSHLQHGSLARGIARSRPHVHRLASPVSLNGLAHQSRTFTRLSESTCSEGKPCSRAASTIRSRYARVGHCGVSLHRSARAT